MMNLQMRERITIRGRQSDRIFARVEQWLMKNTRQGLSDEGLQELW
jgi:hypothetical protein